MSNLWLKKIDGLSKLAPIPLLRGRRNYSSEFSTLLVRPGGLGDLVVNSRAVIEHAIDPRRILWVVEKRNKIWADYLRLPYTLYDSIGQLTRLVLGKTGYRNVICTEQYHGLAAVFSARLAGKDGTLSGFSCNPRSAIYDQIVEYDPLKDHQLAGFKSLIVRSCPDKLGSVVASEFIFPEIQRAQDCRYNVLALGGLTCSYRKLPLEAWKALLERASKNVEKVFLLGAPGEREFAELLAADAKSPTINEVGAIPFNQTVELIRGASRFFGIDSGLLHVADFFKVASEAVFVKWKVAQWSPTTAGSTIIDHNALCESVGAS